MTQEPQREEHQSSSSWGLVVLFWAIVLIPLAWGVYETLTSVAALFTG